MYSHPTRGVVYSICTDMSSVINPKLLKPGRLIHTYNIFAFYDSSLHAHASCAFLPCFHCLTAILLCGLLPETHLFLKNVTRRYEKKVVT